MMEKEKTNYSEVIGIQMVKVIDSVKDLVGKKSSNSDNISVEDPSTTQVEVLDRNKSPNGVYLEWENKRMVIKDAIFTLACVGFIVFALYIAANKDSLIVPSIRYPDGLVVEGNCPFVHEEYIKARSGGYGLLCPNGSCKDDFNTLAFRAAYDGWDKPYYNLTMRNTTITMSNVSTVISNTSNASVDGLQCPVVEEKLCPVAEECVCPYPTCPDIPACPSCECPYQNGLAKKELRQSLNIRPKPNNSPAYSAGCFQCLKDNWIVLKIPVCDGTNDNYCRPKYKMSSPSGYKELNRKIDDEL